MKSYHFIRTGLLLILSFAVLATACNNDDSPVEPNRYPPTARGAFESYWKGVNQNYQFFSIHNLDWDRAYDENVGRINDNMTTSEFLDVITAMSSDIKDYHFTLTIDDSYVWSPDANNPRFQNEIFFGFDYYESLINGYLDEGAVADTTYELGYGTFTVGANTVQYVRLSSFNLTDVRDERPTLLDSLLTFIQNPPSNARGIIVDLRDNTGGYANDLNIFAASFLPGSTRIADLRYRDGNNRNEYTPWVPFTVTGTSQTNSLPVVVLTDAYSVNAAEITTLALQTRSNVTVIGDTTFGAQGLVTSSTQAEDIYLGGTFSLPLTGWKVIMAESQTRALDGQIYESRGLPPDQLLEYSLDILRNNSQDNQMNAAINYLLGTNYRTKSGTVATSINKSIPNAARFENSGLRGKQVAEYRYKTMLDLARKSQ